MAESSLNTAPPAVKDFVERFYRLLDGESPQACEEFTAMFDEEAEFITPVVTLKGRQEIKAQRQQFWTTFPGVKHQPLRVYISPASPLDIIVVNNFKFTKDGEKRVSYTAAEFRLVEVNGARLIKNLQAFLKDRSGFILFSIVSSKSLDSAPQSPLIRAGRKEQFIRGILGVKYSIAVSAFWHWTFIHTVATQVVYGMQCLSVPTRMDIDHAHGNGTWLDIGVPSVRNLFYIPKARSAMWICLVLSSLLLHLVYNSTIFSTTAAHSYTIFAGHSSLGTEPREGIKTGHLDEKDTASFDWLYSCAQNGTLVELDAHACISVYATAYQTKYGDLLLVTDDVETTLDYLMVGFQTVYDPWEAHVHPPPFGDPYGWLCPRSTYLPGLHAAVEQGNWVVYGYYGNYTVDSCLSAPLPEHCKLQYSLPLTIVVIVVNAVKATILCYMAVSTTQLPMLTTGDAVASFLQRPDRNTLGRCLVSVSTANWVLVVTMWAIAFGICAILLMIGLAQDGDEAWNAEFGSIHERNLIKGENWPTSLTANTIIANIPQVIFSTLYFIFNRIMTDMTLAAEWSQYAISHRGLRVSWNPQYAQRSRSFISLPYRYGVPLMASSTIMHWLICQSLFLVGVEAYRQRIVRTPDRDVATCGYSPVAIVSAIGVWVFMFACLLGLSRTKFASGIPIADSCSIAIAAACHPRYDPNLDKQDQRLDPPEGIEFMPLKWGAVSLEGQLGHCTFSPDQVEMPESRRVYQ